VGEYTHEETEKHPISGDESRPLESLAEASGLLGWLVLRYWTGRVGDFRVASTRDLHIAAWLIVQLRIERIRASGRADRL